MRELVGGGEGWTKESHPRTDLGNAGESPALAPLVKPPEPVIEAIVEQEADYQEHVDAVVDDLGSAHKRMSALARRLYRMRSNGLLGKRDTKKAFVAGFVALALKEYCADLPRLKDLADHHLKAHLKAAAATEGRLKQLPAVKKADIKARVQARREARALSVGEDKPVLSLTEGVCTCGTLVPCTVCEPIELAGKPKLKGPGRGRLPSLENLADKKPEELMRTLDRFGLKPDVKAFERRAKALYESRLEAVIEEKGTPDRHTWAAIDADMQTAMRSTLRQQVKQTLQQYRLERLSLLGPNVMFVWIAVIDERTCPSCEERHGTEAPMGVWITVGRPGSAVLICKKECRCQLVPAITAGDLAALED